MKSCSILKIYAINHLKYSRNFILNTFPRSSANLSRGRCCTLDNVSEPLQDADFTAADATRFTSGVHARRCSPATNRRPTGDQPAHSATSPGPQSGFSATIYVWWNWDDKNRKGWEEMSIKHWACFIKFGSVYRFWEQLKHKVQLVSWIISFFSARTRYARAWNMYYDLYICLCFVNLQEIISTPLAELRVHPHVHRDAYFDPKQRGNLCYRCVHLEQSIRFCSNCVGTEQRWIEVWSSSV